MQVAARKAIPSHHSLRVILLTAKSIVRSDKGRSQDLRFSREGDGVARLRLLAV